MDHAEHVERDNRRRKILGYIRTDPGIAVEKLAAKTRAPIGEVLIDLDELEAEGRIYTDTCPGCRRRRRMVAGVRH